MTWSNDAKIELLTQGEQVELNNRLSAVGEALRNRYHLSEDCTHSDRFEAIQGAVDEKLFKFDVSRWQSLGLFFGEELRRHNSLEWVMVDDEYGRDFALRMPHTSVLVFPLTMISKRIERLEPVDVEYLRDSVEKDLQKHRFPAP